MEKKDDEMTLPLGGVWGPCVMPSLAGTIGRSATAASGKRVSASIADLPKFQRNYRVAPAPPASLTYTKSRKEAIRDVLEDMRSLLDLWDHS